MSVTFFAVNAFESICAVYDNRDGSFEPNGPAVIVSTATPFEFNVSQFNYGRVLTLLGIAEEEQDCVGHIPVDQLSTALDALPNTWERGDYVSQIKDLLLYCIHLQSSLHWG